MMTPREDTYRLALQDCYTLARCQIARILITGGDEEIFIAWQRIRGFCERAGLDERTLRSLSEVQGLLF